VAVWAMPTMAHAAATVAMHRIKGSFRLVIASSSWIFGSHFL
jgi:hypothetical protein